MSAHLVTMADGEETARTVDRYLRCLLGSSIESFFMTYGQRKLTKHLYSLADLFLLELLRRDALGARAEAIPVAEKWAAAGKRVLIFSGSAQANRAANPCYWDLAAADTLHDRVVKLLGSPAAEPEVFTALRDIFGYYCRSAPPSHH